MTEPTARDLWAHPPARRTIVDVPILRPRDMLAQYGMRRDRLCRDCDQFEPRTQGLGRCRRSLRGNPPSAGYAWRADWRACGAWAAAAPKPEAEPGAAQPSLFDA